MRDIINANICENHFLKCSTYSIARNGEGLTPCLSISIPDGLVDFWAYIDFKKPNGETFKTPRIDVNVGKITYNIPSSVLDADGKLEVQVVFQNANGDIWKTYVKEFAVRYSINATDDIPDKPDFITEAQKLLDEAVETAKSVEERANNGEFDYVLTNTDKQEIAGMVDVPEVDQTYNPESENAQSGIAVAEAISGKADIPKDYELIETITTTEEVLSIIKNTEPNGTPYNFDKLCLFIKMGTANKTMDLCWIVNGYYGSGIGSGFHSSWSACSVMEIYRDKQLKKPRISLTNHTNDWSNSCYQQTHKIIKGGNNEPFKRFELYSVGRATPFPVGTKIEIWGVRA